MDDFGTGYSSLSYLQSFPFDKIKIDQTFVAKLGKNFQSAAIIHAILGLGQALRLPVLAEGVETEEQRAFLAKEGCTESGLSDRTAAADRSLRSSGDGFGQRRSSGRTCQLMMERPPNPRGDRVKITMSGKFLRYKYYGASGNVPEYGFKEEPGLRRDDKLRGLSGDRTKHRAGQAN
jgi:hypothetical protein